VTISMLAARGAEATAVPHDKLGALNWVQLLFRCSEPRKK